jgi:hypothetical protein
MPDDHTRDCQSGTEIRDQTLSAADSNDAIEPSSLLSSATGYEDPWQAIR